MSGRRNVCLRPLSGSLAGGVVASPRVRVWCCEGLGGVPYRPSTGLISALASGPDLGLLLSGEPLEGGNKTKENLPLSSRSVSFLLCFFKELWSPCLCLWMSGLGKTNRWQGFEEGKFLLVSCKQSKRDPFSALLQGAEPSYWTSESLTWRHCSVGNPVLVVGSYPLVA